MIDTIVKFFSQFPAELATALLATLPVTELRAALPIGITVFGLEPQSALLFSLLGNVVPMIVIFLLLPVIVDFAQKHSKWLDKVLKNYFFSLEKKHKERYLRYGTAILFIFVAIPLPGSGVWTGSFLAVLFKIRPKYSVPAILAGLIVSGFIVLTLTVGYQHLFVL